MSNTKPALGERLRMDWITYLNSRKHSIRSAWFCIIIGAYNILSAALSYVHSEGKLDALDRFDVVGGFIIGLALIVVFSVELYFAYRAKHEDLARKESQ